MKKSNAENQPPIFRFLKKHKWRIILPFLFSLLYFALPHYLTEIVAVQQNVFYKSNVFSKSEINKEFSVIRSKILSDESLRNLIFKYDLYKSERENNTSENSLFQKLRNSIEIRLDDEGNNNSLFIWIHFRKENSQNIAELSNEVLRQFENNPNIYIDKYVTEPYDANVYRKYVFFGRLMQGLFFFSIPLIFLWEIPNMFYSPKTKEMVFEPLKADWQEEIMDAKLRNEKLKVLQINVRYSLAFLSAMIQKSPLGDLFEFFGKMVR